MQESDVTFKPKTMYQNNENAKKEIIALVIYWAPELAVKAEVV